MRKAIVIGGLVAAAIVAIVLISSGGGGSDGYVVRAIFDNGGFMVKGEQVRVAGANVGEIESVGVTLPGEVDSYEGGKEQAVSGKAVIVMKITDPGFQDFRSDASCLIRPQSLIGEKFVDCRPTLPRAPGTEPAPPLKKVPVRPARRGPVPAAAGEQQHQRRPRPDQRHQQTALRAALPPDLQRTRRRPGRPRRRHRGGGEARQPGPARRRPPDRHPQRPARPADPARRRLRADPRAALARTRPASPASSPTPAPPLRPRPNAARTWKPRCRSSPPSCASSALTMRSLQGFSDAATPTFADLGKAAPSFTEATRLLTPFSAASTVALKSLGATGEEAGPTLRAADPIVRKTTRAGPDRRQPDRRSWPNSSPAPRKRRASTALSI